MSLPAHRLFLARRIPLLLSALLAAGCGAPEPPKVHVAGGDPQRGRALVERYGCVACHSIPGVASYGANVGPPLVSLSRRGYLAGVLPNTSQDMVRWLRDPPAVDPRTAMPNLGVSHAEALDIAAFLYSH